MRFFFLTLVISLGIILNLAWVYIRGSGELTFLIDHFFLIFVNFLQGFLACWLLFAWRLKEIKEFFYDGFELHLSSEKTDQPSDRPADAGSGAGDPGDNSKDA